MKLPSLADVRSPTLYETLSDEDVLLENDDEAEQPLPAAVKAFISNGKASFIEAADASATHFPDAPDVWPPVA
jgi:hypothetical protein